MNSRASKRKKKKDRTWAEAAVLALQMSPNKMLSIRQILQAIHQQSLKEISMNKAAENVLTTMLNHHAQLPNCSFFRVKGRLGLYALKKSHLKKNGESTHEKTDDADACEDEDDVSLSALLTTTPCDDRLGGCTNEVGRENHTYSIQGRALRPDQNNRKPVKPFSNPAFRKKYSSLPQGVAASVGSSRRHSSPLVCPYQSTRSAVTNRHPHHTVTRANSFTTRHTATVSHPSHSSPKHASTLDLETPSSILVNANMRALVNRETFSMLPPSYRYMLTKLLPGCDQALTDVDGGEQKIITPSQTALTNEFFTQAVQEWRERLADGEFTQETQSRIVQEIAKERSKIDPWKEKFFEEYYGQKQVPKKRLRSRSQNLAAETGHKMRDLGMEAQLQLFAHLRPELQDTQDSESSSSDADLQISDDDEEFFKPAIPRRLTPSNNLHLRTLAVANSFKKISYAERVAKNKLMNSRLTSLRTKKASTSGFEAPERSKVIPKKLMKNTTATSSVAGESAIILKPSWSVSAFSRCVKKSRLQMNPPPLATNEDTPDQDSNSKAILNVQKRSDNVSTAMADHSYTSALWLQNSTNSSTNNNHAAKPMTSSSATSRSSSTLVLCPSGNLTHFTIANMTSAKLLGGSKKGPSVSSSASDPIKSSLARLKMDATGSSSLKPAAHLLSTGVPTSSSETERVLSLCARPLTPESFVPGSVKPAGVISVKRVQSPLSLDPPAEVPSSASSNKIKSQIKQEVKQKEESDVTETKSPLLQPSKIKGSVLPALSSSPTTTSAPVISASRTTHTVSKPISKKSLVPSLNANTFPSLSAPSTATVSAVSCLSNASLTVPSVALSAYGHMIPSTLMQCRSEMMLPHNFSHPLQVASLYPSMLPTVSPHPPMPSTVPFRPPAPHTASSPLIPGRLSLAGKKRSFPPPPATVPLESPPARWSISSGSSPSPMKKTRTLAEIKAQMKAKRAAAASTKPLPPHQPGVVAPNSRTHLFSAPTFPVYFPMVTDGDVSNPINHSQNSLLSNYIRLPTTATLPLEKVQWVSHQMAPSIQASTPSNQLFNHTHVAAALRNPVPTQQPPVVATSSSSTTSSTKQPQPSAQTTKSEGKGKITLKIKAAGSAISLKVDADVIKKELKRSAQSPSSDDDLSSDDSISDESDVDRPRISKHRGPIKLPKVARRSSDSGSDLEKSTERRWAPNAIDTGQPMKKPNAPTLRQTPVTSPILLPKPPPVFGKSPFNVSVKPATTIMDPAVNHFTKNNLFHHKPPLSFSSVPASISWAANKVVSNTSSAMASDPLPTSLYQSSKYRSTSKGKSLQNMQELARTNRIHSDDSAEEDEDSSGDEDPCDSTFSTTTASENDKCSESDDDHPVPTWTGGKSSADKVMTINDKRSTRSSNVGNKQKKTGV